MTRQPRQMGRRWYPELTEENPMPQTAKHDVILHFFDNSTTPSAEAHYYIRIATRDGPRLAEELLQDMRRYVRDDVTLNVEVVPSRFNARALEAKAP